MKIKLTLLLIFTISGSLLAGNHVADIVVDPGNYTRYNCPVSVSIEGFRINLSEGLKLFERSGSEIVETECQLEPGISPRLWWILDGETKPGELRYYSLFSEKKQSANNISIFLDESVLNIFNGTKNILQYNHAPVPPPEGVDPLFTRGAFIHPLWTPDGEVLTRIQPPDHYHHLGIWNPWTKTKFEGREVDFWNLGKGQGTVRFKAFSSLISGNVFGGFSALHEHVDLTSPEGEKTALNEEWEIRVWNTGKNEQDYWMIDIISTLNCATGSQLIIEKYRYAGLGFRATELWGTDNSGTRTSEGLTGREGDATRARWCNVFGEMRNGQAGIVFMSHPYNREHPEPMRIWPENTNGGKENMFFEFCPIRENDWIIEPGKDYTLRYRLYVYNGEVSDEQSENLWRDFAFPPKTRIIDN